MAARLKLVTPETGNGSDADTPPSRSVRRPILPDDADHRRRFHSPRGAERPGHAIRQYYNPRPGVLAKKQRIRKAGAALFARYGIAAIGLNRVAEAAGLDPTGAKIYYHGRNELLAEIVAEHLQTLTVALGAAHDAHANSPAELLLEAQIRAWLDATAAAPDEHRTMLICAHLLPEERRDALALRRQVLLESVLAPLLAAAPALRDGPEASAPLLGLLDALLNPLSAWPNPPEPECRRRDARRIAGMLLAAAQAESDGLWPRLGGCAGAARGARLVVECQQARARFRETLDAALSGAEVVITRRGRPAARLIGLG